MNRFLYAVLIVVSILLLPRVLGLTLPFIIGLLFYLMCRRPVRRMAAAGINRGLAAAFSLFFMLVLVGGVCATLFSLAYNERDRLPRLYQHISALQMENTLLQSFLATLHEELSEAARSISVFLISQLSHLTEVLMILLFAMLSAFFFLRDEERLVDIIVRNGGRRFIENVQILSQAAREALSGYIRAQGILMAITFVILSVFLVLFGVRSAVLIALGIAFLDAIPVFGTGFVLLPWAAWEFFSQNSSLAFGLLALYGVCSLTRQIFEPKILSAQIGLHPLLTLTGIFIGFKLLGITGLILGPSAMLIIVTYLQKRQ